MNKPLLISLAAATLLSSNLSAESMYERIQAMELQMKNMKQELETLKAEQKSPKEAPEEEIEVAVSDADDEEDDEGEEDEEESVQDQLDEIQENLTDLNKATNGNHLKFGVDYRFAIDNLQYEMADGSKQSNDAFMTNRFWLNMDWKANKNLSFLRDSLLITKPLGHVQDQAVLYLHHMKHLIGLQMKMLMMILSDCVLLTFYMSTIHF